MGIGNGIYSVVDAWNGACSDAVIAFVKSGKLKTLAVPIEGLSTMVTMVACDDHDEHCHGSGFAENDVVIGTM